ncbi:MAG: hypothetical protein U0350_39445 [Caldilineaceae bacterium]
MSFKDRVEHCLSFGLAGTVGFALLHYLLPRSTEPSLVLFVRVWWTCGVLAILVFPYITPQ